MMPPIFIETLPFSLFSQFSVFIHSTSPPSSSSSNQRMCTNDPHLLPAYASKRKHRSKPKVQIYGLTRYAPHMYNFLGFIYFN